jgi:hypothetical protein
MALEPKAAKPQTEEVARPAEQTETATAPRAPEIKPVEAPAASRAFNRPWGSLPDVASYHGGLNRRCDLQSSRGRIWFP